jgi:ABC-type Mn2+/Zn2+ transport system permease subunit
MQKRVTPFLFATLFGSIGVLFALIGSYQLDLPTGYTIIFVTVFTSLLFVVLSSLKKREQ